MFRNYLSEVKNFSVDNKSLELKIGELLYFYYTQLDGANEYINCGNDNSLNFERTDPFSFSVWVKNDALNVTNLLLSKREQITNSPKGYGLWIGGDNKIYFLLSNAQAFPVANRIFVKSNDTILTFGEWIHISATYDGSSSAIGVNIYINGVSSSITTMNDNLTLSTQHNYQLDIGANSYAGVYLDGGLDEISIFDTELTASDVLDVYNLGRKNPDLTSISGVVSHWRMDAIDPVDRIGTNDGTGVNIDATNIIGWS